MRLRRVSNRGGVGACTCTGLCGRYRLPTAWPSPAMGYFAPADVLAQFGQAQTDL
jgi:hypothetical protein